MRNDEIEEIERNNKESEKNTSQHLNTNGTYESEFVQQIEFNEAAIDVGSIMCSTCHNTCHITF